MRKAIAILLAVLFLVSLTASAVTARSGNVLKDHKEKIDKDKKDKDPIKIKSHPVLKSPRSTAITALGQRWGPEGSKK